MLQGEETRDEHVVFSMTELFKKYSYNYIGFTNQLKNL